MVLRIVITFHAAVITSSLLHIFHIRNMFSALLLAPLNSMRASNRHPLLLEANRITV